jgi:competence protein ComEC
VFLAGPLHGWIVAGICVVMRRETIPGVISGLIVMPLATTVAAIVATEPLIALNFGRLSLVAVPANMLIVPAFPIILWSSLVASIGGLVPGVHLIGAAPAHFALAYWIAVTTWLADLPAASVSIGAYTSWWAGTTYVAISAVAFLFLRFAAAPSGRRLAPGVDAGTFTPVAAVVVPVVVLIATAGFVLRPDGPARLEVTVLDVGQGDAILIETPNGTDILVDGGPGRAVLRGLGDELAWNDRTIELMVLTHPQADHVTGLLDVLDRYDVRRVIAGPGEETSLGYALWRSAVESERIEVEWPQAGTTFDLGDGVRLEVLGPTADMAADTQLNNTSLVVRLVWRDVSFLLTGDIEAAAEQSLIANGADLRSTVLKVAHHGSKTSSSEAFLNAIQPSIAVVSAGANNQFGHPAPAVVDRLDDFAAVLTTSELGGVHFETDGERLWISTGK